MHTTGHFFHFFKNRELNEMYVSISIRSFALALIGVFIPIYFYTKGYSLTAIFLFYIIQSLSHITFSIPAAKISSRYGIKHSMLFSVPFLILFFFLLYSLDTFNWPLPVLSIFAGLSTALFWIPYHIDFAKFTDRKNRGKQIGFSGIVASLFSIAGPILGAVLLTLVGFKMLFITVSALLFVSIIPLFFSKEVHQPVGFSLRGFFEGQRARDVVSFLGHGIESKMSAIVWPLFVFIFIFGEKYTSLGIVSSLTIGIAFISTIFIGKFSDMRRTAVLKVGSIMNSGVWIARSFIVTPLQVFVTDAFYGMSNTTMHIPFDAKNYDKVDKKNGVAKVILEREIYHHVGVVILFSLLIFFTESSTELFRYGGPISSLMRFFF